jgi:ankyrin repeat protein
MPAYVRQVSDSKCCDYDKRTPLHLAASEGSYKVSEWLLENKADVNALDRFKRTPLEVGIVRGLGRVRKRGRGQPVCVVWVARLGSYIGAGA